jgi:hypothetical protein
MEDRMNKEKLNIIIKFLNEFEKEYSIKYWNSGEGVDIIVKQYVTDTKDKFLTISLNDGEYLTFEGFEDEETKSAEEMK